MRWGDGVAVSGCGGILSEGNTRWGCLGILRGGRSGDLSVGSGMGVRARGRRGMGGGTAALHHQTKGVG